MADPVEIGLGLQSDKRGDDYVRLATLAEDCGFDVLSVYGDLLFQPPIYPLLEMARVASRARLGAACWNAYTLHPYEIAGQLAALQQAPAGRAYLGLARGSWLDAIGIRQARQVTHLREGPYPTGRPHCSSAPGDRRPPRWPASWPTRSRSEAPPTRR